MARVYQPQPWVSGTGMTFDQGPPVIGDSPSKRHIVSAGGSPSSFTTRLREEYESHEAYYKFLIGVSAFVLIIIGLVVYSGLHPSSTP